MTKPLSNDLRERLIAAVAEGTTRRAAAERFGVAASTAIKWVQRWRKTGVLSPRPQGGDKRSARIEAHAAEIPGLLAKKPGHLIGRDRFAPSTIWRFLDRWMARPSRPGSRRCSRRRSDARANIRITPDDCGSYFTAAGYGSA